MNAVGECRTWICAVPRGPFDTRGTWLQQVGKIFGIHPKLASDIFYERRKRLDADTYNQMKEKLTALQTRTLERRETLNDLDIRLAALRSHQGNGAPEGDSRRAAPLGGRSDGEIPGRHSEG
jgi:hypothetical protein